MIRTLRCAGVLTLFALGIAACHSQNNPASTGVHPDVDHRSDGEITLSDLQLQRLRVQSEALSAATYAVEVVGYGAEVPRVSLIGGMTEADLASSAAVQSRSALKRAQALASTAGAFSLDAEQAIERQASADAAAEALAGTRVETLIGDPSADATERALILKRLVRGDVQLVRVTFPSQVLPLTRQPRVQVEALDQTAHRSWWAQRTWMAPADPSFTGHSVFALLSRGALDEGERVVAHATVGASQNGVIVPATALVLYDSHYWCFIETQRNHFRRVQVPVDAPSNDGYFVTEGVHAGDRIVTAAAGLLLSQQSDSGSDGD